MKKKWLKNNERLLTIPPEQLQLFIYWANDVFNGRNIFTPGVGRALILVSRPITGLLSVKPIFESPVGGREAQSSSSCALLKTRR